MIQSKIILIICLSLILSSGLIGCQDAGSNETQESPSTTTHGDVHHLKNLSADLKTLKLPPLTCAANHTCPPGVGELVVVTSKGVQFCTASLVAPDVVLTAAHCLPWENIRDKKFLGGCWVRWPSNTGLSPDTQAHELSCKELLEGTQLNGGPSGQVKLDHAFIRLAKKQRYRAPLAIIEEDEEANDNQVHLFGTSLSEKSHSIYGVSCERDDSFSIPGIEALPNKTIILPSCPIESGYSGGPIFDSRSTRVIGVVSFMRSRSGSRPGLAVGTDISQLPQ